MWRFPSRVLSRAACSLSRGRVLAATRAATATAGLVTTACVAASAVGRLADFESCDSIGDGLKGEFWKARHKNVNVLELESEVVQQMMTKLRDKTLSDTGFVLLAERIAFFVIEHALAELPSEETTVETLYGHKYTGVMRSDGIKLCGIGVAEDGGQMLSILTKLESDMPVAHMQRSRGNRRLFVVPSISDIPDRYCVVLAPIMKTGGTVIDTITKLEELGVDEEKVIVVCITCGPGALDRLAKERPEVTVVTASVEAGLDKNHQLMPGIGVFSLRYTPESS